MTSATGRMSSARAIELVGRGAECTRIDRLLAGGRRGESGTLVLRGEAGMGKSALLGYAAGRSGDMTVLRVTASSGSLSSRSPASMACCGRSWTGWRRYPSHNAPHSPPRLGSLAGEGGDRFLVSAGVLSLLAAAAESNPILCVVDDAQWLDAPSANALSFVARRLVAEEIAILFGAREGEHRRFDSPGLEELYVPEIDHESAGRLLDHSAPGASTLGATCARRSSCSGAQDSRPGRHGRAPSCAPGARPPASATRRPGIS